MILAGLTCFLMYVSFSCAAEITHYWRDHKLLPPIVNSFNVTSIPSCIHRCNIDKNCNAVAVSTHLFDAIMCLHAWIECYEKYIDRIASAKEWDVYTFRDKGGLPFVLAYRSGSVRKCTKISYSGYLVITNNCNELFCKNAYNQIVNIATKNCLSAKNYISGGADVALSTTCDDKAEFRETYRAVQQVKTAWHMHPQYSHHNPPEGTKVVIWQIGTYWFYFDYRKEFL